MSFRFSLLQASAQPVIRPPDQLSIERIAPLRFHFLRSSLEDSVLAHSPVEVPDITVQFSSHPSLDRDSPRAHSSLEIVRETLLEMRI